MAHHTVQHSYVVMLNCDRRIGALRRVFAFRNWLGGHLFTLGIACRCCCGDCNLGLFPPGGCYLYNRLTALSCCQRVCVPPVTSATVTQRADLYYAPIPTVLIGHWGTVSGLVGMWSDFGQCLSCEQDCLLGVL